MKPLAIYPANEYVTRPDPPDETQKMTTRNLSAADGAAPASFLALFAKARKELGHPLTEADVVRLAEEAPPLPPAFIQSREERRNRNVLQLAAKYLTGERLEAAAFAAGVAIAEQDARCRAITQAQASGAATRDNPDLMRRSWWRSLLAGAARSA
jgi:hypothetical protein